MTKHTLSGDWITREVFLDGKPLNPAPSQKIYNHSPDGFNWGYGGSGPAQLALAIMLSLTGNSDWYQDFKFKVIAALPRTNFECEFWLEPEYGFKLVSAGPMEMEANNEN